MMNATEVKSKIAAADRKGEELRGEIARLETRRAALLRELTPEGGGYEGKKTRAHLDEIDAHLETTRADLHRFRDQVEALRDALPNEGEVADAEDRVSDLLDAAADHSTTFSIAWSRLLDGLSEAGQSAREAVESRGRHRAAVSEAATLVSQWGLDREDLPRHSPRTGPEALVGSPAEVALGLAFVDLVRSALSGAVELDGAAVGAVEDALRAIERKAA